MVLLESITHLLHVPIPGPETTWFIGLLANNCFQYVSLSFFLKYVLLGSILAFVAIRFLRQRSQMVALINKIPGPPVDPWFPWLGHAMLVLDLDRCKFEHGTYACKFNFSYNYINNPFSIDSKSY